MSIGPNQFESFAERLLAQLRLLYDQIGTIRDSQEANRKTQQQIVAALSDLRKTEQEKREDRARHNQNFSIQAILTAGTWLTFLAAAGYGGVAYWQATLTKKALHDNGDALTQTLGRLDQQTQATNRLAAATETANNDVLDADRPWFGIILSAQDPLEVGKNPSITVVFTNSGKRPAKVIVSEVIANWFTVFPKNPPWGVPPNSIQSNNIVVPNDNVTIKTNLFTAPLSQRDIDLANGGVVKLFIYARVEYIDLRTLGRHFTHISWMYIGNQPNLAAKFYNSPEVEDAN